MLNLHMGPIIFCFLLRPMFIISKLNPWHATAYLYQIWLLLEFYGGNFDVGFAYRIFYYDFVPGYYVSRIWYWIGRSCLANIQSILTLLFQSHFALRFLFLKISAIDNLITLPSKDLQNEDLWKQTPQLNRWVPLKLGPKIYLDHSRGNHVL